VIENKQQRRLRRSGGGSISIADCPKAVRRSRATVSQIWNFSQTVSNVLPALVQNGAAKLGYFPHGSGRTLAPRHCMTSGAIVLMLNKTIFVRYINVFQRRLNELDFIFLPSKSKYDNGSELKQARFFMQYHTYFYNLIGIRYNCNGALVYLPIAPPDKDINRREKT